MRCRRSAYFALFLVTMSALFGPFASESGAQPLAKRAVRSAASGASAAGPFLISTSTSYPATAAHGAYKFIEWYPEAGTTEAASTYDDSGTLVAKGQLSSSAQPCPTSTYACSSLAFASNSKVVRVATTDLVVFPTVREWATHTSISSPCATPCSSLTLPVGEYLPPSYIRSAIRSHRFVPSAVDVTIDGAAALPISLEDPITRQVLPPGPVMWVRPGSDEIVRVDMPGFPAVVDFSWHRATRALMRNLELAVPKGYARASSNYAIGGPVRFSAPPAATS